MRNLGNVCGISSLAVIFVLAGGTPATAQSGSPAEAAFKQKVLPLLENPCSGCHNQQVASGGYDFAQFSDAASIARNPEGWRTIVHKLRAGEMPPAGIPRPPQAQIDGLVQFVEAEIARIESKIAPDPGRVTAHRLNRSEYTNTIRDLLGVEFRADRNFPSDDSGDGFDNIADVLTISPLLMERYLTAAERIATRALGREKLPKPVEVTYNLASAISGSPPSIGSGVQAGSIRRIDLDTIEATHRFDFDGEYEIHIGMPGERSEDAKPVTMKVWLDGNLVLTRQVETKPSGLVYFEPFAEEQFRQFVPEGQHTVRAAFVDDEFAKTLEEKDYYRTRKNRWPDVFTIVGPFPTSVEKPSRKRLLICDPATGQACVERILTTLAHRAYRRPPTRQEIAQLVQLAESARNDGRGIERGIEMAVTAVLVSPQFLFRIERDSNPTDPSAVHKISDIELASRLSYFLWRSMPDDELLEVAEAGKLSDPATLDAQIKRLIADERSVSLADDFAGQWLELRNLDLVKPDPDRFLYWGPELRAAMKTETRMFFDYILRNNRPIAEFLDARYTFLNERLAKFYGIEGVTGSEFRKVDLNTNQRGGLLSQASILTVSSYPTRTSVVLRGKYVLQNILGTPPPPPPANVPPLDESKVGTAASLRQQMETHRANPACAVCHTKMDSLGFGLENYDGIGKWRTSDGSFPVDSTGTLPNGKTFQGPGEMRATLVGLLPQFAHNMVEKVMIYALGRGLEPYDRKTVDGIVGRLEAQGYPFQSILYEVARSYPFQSRRGEQQLAQNTAGKETAR